MTQKEKLMKTTLQNKALPSLRNIKKIYRIMDFIEFNLLKQDDFSVFELETLARKVKLSPFYFQRLFKQIAGETPREFTRRLRIEKAASLISSNPKDTLTDISEDVKFKYQAHLSSHFSEYFNQTPREFQKEVLQETDRYFSENSFEPLPYHIAPLPFFSQINDKIRVVYEKHTGTYDKLEKAWDRLFSRESQMTEITQSAFYFGVIYDNPLITEPRKCLYDACIAVPHNFQNPAAITKYFSLSQFGSDFAVFSFDGTVDQVEHFYARMYETVFRNSVKNRAVYDKGNKYSQRDPLTVRDAYTVELYKNDPDEENGIIRMDVYIPIKGKNL